MVPAVRGHRRHFGAGQPVHLLHARPDAVGLLGRPARLRAAASAAAWASACSGSTAGSITRPIAMASVIAWALHHRMWMAVIAVADRWSSALALQVTVGGSEFLPKSDYGMIAVEVRTPSSASLEYARCKVEKAAELAREIPETKATDSQRQRERRPRLGRPRQRAPTAIVRLGEIAAATARARSSSWSAPNTWCSTISTTARRSRCRSSSTARTRARLMEITNDFMEKMRKMPGAVDVGLSEQEPQGRAAHRARSRTRQPARHLRGRCRAGAARGVRRRGSGRLGGSDRRIARRRGAPAPG